MHIQKLRFCKPEYLPAYSQARTKHIRLPAYLSKLLKRVLETLTLQQRSLAYSLRLLIVVVLLLPGSNTYSKGDDADNQPASQMDIVIVTASQPNSILYIPRNVSVIDSLDIESSGASTIQELLSSQANITLTSFSGNSKFTSIDIRGSGDTGVSNVLVLIDGIQLNTPDLNGAEFSVIPVEQVERIEIVRGANAVRVGSGASQGVIQYPDQVCTRRLQAFDEKHHA